MERAPPQSACANMHATELKSAACQARRRERILFALMRVDDLLVKKWVFEDVLHVLLQLGYDVFAEEVKRP